jgi:hypothetical protein
MPDIQSLQPSNLLVDPENPRLSEPSQGQREVLRLMATHQQRKLLVLAKDLVENGLNPSDLPIVMPAGDDLNRHIVLEGNRRLVALKALENPDALVGAIDGPVITELRELSREYQRAPIDYVRCVVVKDRADAEHWITLRHTGENEGAGTVRWGADESARFRARSGGVEIHTQALDFLENNGHLTPAERSKVPVTSLKRLLGTPEVRAKLGLGLQDGKLQVLADEAAVSKALKYVVNELISGTKKTKNIYHKEQRIDYAESLPATIIVTQTKKARDIDSVRLSKAKAPRKQPKVVQVRPRDHLIPRDCVLSISQARLQAIEGELRALSLENYANAVSVLLRVFIELSIDEYLDSHSLTCTATDKLRNKAEAVVADLLSRKKLTSQQARPVRRAMQKGSFLAPSIDLMHDYIHNQNVFPAPADLRANWDSL